MRKPVGERSDDILDVVIELLETEGYEAVQVRRVAKLANISLTTLYKLFTSRDELIVVALERWMEEHAYAEAAVPAEGESPHACLVRMIRAIFAPWEENPLMFKAYARARLGPGGRRLDRQGFRAMVPVGAAAMRDVDPDVANDIGLVLRHVVNSLVNLCMTDQIDVTEIAPTVERTLALVFASDRAST